MDPMNGPMNQMGMIGHERPWREEQLTMEQQQLQMQQQMDEQLRAQREALEQQQRQMKKAVELARVHAETAAAGLVIPLDPTARR